MNQYLLYKYVYFVNLDELFYLNKFILKECKLSFYSFYLHGKYLYFLVYIISINQLTFSDNKCKNHGMLKHLSGTRKNHYDTFNMKHFILYLMIVSVYESDGNFQAVHLTYQEP